VTSIDDIDHVADGMRSIVDTARREESPDGYFAAMYLGVTAVVKQGLQDGRFTTPDRLARLTRIFAQRYLDAWHLHRDGGTPTGPWALAFEAADQWRPTVLQHLLLGMNAHINLDLGIASATVAPGDAIGELKPDFDEINGVLAGLVQGIQDELNRVSPCYRFVDDVGGPVDRAVINFSIGRARASAWRFATTLAGADDAARQDLVARRDEEVTRLGGDVLHPGFVATGLFVVRLTEWRRPSGVIDVLSGAVREAVAEV
jgi:hypothetical protein